MCVLFSLVISTINKPGLKIYNRRILMLWIGSPIIGTVEDIDKFGYMLY